MLSLNYSKWSCRGLINGGRLCGLWELTSFLIWVVYERFPEAREEGWRHSCFQGVAFVDGDLLGTPLDTNNYFHTSPCLLAFMSPGFYHLALAR